ncbi:MAG: 16S rRNA (cytosine(1402)-N(4))-methyltransferase RsmH [Eubacteriaceae bacterium]|uniref:Ribosomal RNA small subunit methyltransferase H n=1 Tax=Candidatus Pseudoramibacter fermentans TaxID=2594427 RepID=A0A6L5GQT5_9FIRM|nr:16S rRNA (cytosine(1402)-N(4))-methyltransferase RsmH [Candidatus Pseudoramibacter fermentans]RRF94022.1 MAG: 16S rRNA (cytosine(1402)-N(4))-methyltransferase RsmH [Eubacteriaceae bacterium]
MKSKDQHISVLLNETIDALNVKPDGCYVDCTLGGGGHSEQIAGRLSDQGRLIGIDQDDYAIARAEKRLSSYPCRKDFVRDNFVHLPAILDALQISAVDGVVFDLGVSSFQFDQPERGFSYHHDGPLDMRMDRQQALTAADVVNTYSEQALKQVIFEYGEDKLAGRIARAIVSRRKTQPFRRTLDLADVIRDATPEKFRRKGHPAKKTFQALRIEVNGELRILTQAVKNAIDRTKPGGRICVITFHSLEDRQIKQLFNEQADPCICPPEFPVCVCGRKPTIKKITRKPIAPSAEEVQDNRRARSAKLRVAERLEREETKG